MHGSFALQSTRLLCLFAGARGKAVLQQALGFPRFTPQTTSVRGREVTVRCAGNISRVSSQHRCSAISITSKL